MLVGGGGGGGGGEGSDLNLFNVLSVREDGMFQGLVKFLELL